MTRQEGHDGEERVARTLRASVPAPSPDFLRSLERRLLPPRRRVEPGRIGVTRRLRPARVQLAAGMAALSLALLVLVASLATGPLGGNSEADVDCKTVWVERRAREPVLRRARDGSLRLDYRWRTAPRPVVRCR